MTQPPTSVGKPTPGNRGVPAESSGSKDNAAVSPGSLPNDFISPFQRVAMEGRIDDALACVAIVCGVSLAKVSAEAMAIGYPLHGPATLTESQISQLCLKLANLRATPYQSFKSWSHLPDVSIIFCDWSEDMETGRHVVCHRVHATPERKSFIYILDPAFWLPPERHITTRIDLVVPDLYISISQGSSSNGKPPAAGKSS